MRFSTRTSLLALVLLGLYVALYVAPAVHAVEVATAAEAPSAATPPPRPLPARSFVPETSAWKSQRFVQADDDGRLYLLRVKDLAVVPVTASLEAGEARSLEHLGLEPAGFARDAAMGTEADEWAVLSLEGLHRFVRGKEVPVPEPPWQGVATAVLRGELVVATVPIRRVSLERKGGPGGEPPLVAAWDGKRWSELASAPRRTAAAGMDPVHSVMANGAVRLLAAGRSLWVVDEYAYRVRRFRNDGRLTLELVVGEGEVEAQEGGAPAAGEGEVARSGADPERVRVNPFPARRAIHGAAVAPDGRLYLLVPPREGDGRPALDRFDEATGKVERVPVDYDAEGRASLAAGDDGLFVMPQDPAGEGGWFSWTDLREADWRPVEGARTAPEAARE